MVKGLIMFSIVIAEEKCVGCRACEIACSYHHRKVFDPEISSIEIYMEGKEQSIAAVIHREEGGNNHLACNQCGGETEPLCSKYCDWDAVQVVQRAKGGI